MSPLNSPCPLAASHDLTAFDCGSTALNDFLRKYAVLNEQSNAARTYVATRVNRVVGYYTLTSASVDPVNVPARVVKGLARHPVPVILLARLAVERIEQGQGLGKHLLRDALSRAGLAADIIGCRAVLVHAKDEAAKAFYQRFNFEPSPTNQFHLYLLMKDLKATLGIPPS